MDTSNKETNDAPQSANSEYTIVGCRFTRAELDWLKKETGTLADATAVGSFVRKHLGATPGTPFSAIPDAQTR